MSKISSRKINTFTVGFDAPAFYNEADSAKITADHFSTEHNELIVKAIDIEKYLPKLVWHFDEPFADPVALPTYIISEFASKHVKVVLTGDGADENFAGYVRYKADNFAHITKNTPLILQKNIQKIVNVFPRSKRTKKLFRGIFINSLPQRYATWLAQLTDKLKNELFSEEFDEMKEISSFNIFEEMANKSNVSENLSQMSYLDFKNWLGYVHLIRLDRMSMANSLEARSPFLDKELISLCSKMPSDLKVKRFTSKYILKKTFDGLIPDKILHKKKHGFTVPVEIWFRKELKDYAKDILLDSSFLDIGFFNRRNLENLLSSHFSGREDFGTTIWALINFALWERMFIKNIPLSKEHPVELEMKDKILLVTGDFLPIKGGISTLFFEICSKIPQILVLTKRVRNSEVFDSLHKICIRRIRAFNKYIQPFIFAINALKTVKKEEVDKLVCGQLLIPGFVGYIVHKLLKKPYYVHTYGPEFREHKLWFPLMKLILKNATKIITISDFAKSQLIKQNIPSSKIAVLTPGVNTLRFNPNLNAEKILKRHNLSDKIVLLTVSRLDANKGIDKMINLMPEIQKKYPNVVYMIVGKGPDEQYLKKLAKQRSKKNIIFVGEVSDEELLLYYASCDVFILLTKEVPSKGFVEGFGIVFLEASACGKPIVAGKAGGSEEAVKDKITGLVVDPLNDKEILSSIEKLLEDRTVRKKLGSSGRRRVENEFTWDIKRKQFMDIIS
jgi:glycosyltransferase involved in cell wall biosynthesis